MYDIVIFNGYYMTMEGEGLGFMENLGIAIRNGCIEEIRPAEEIKKLDAEKYINAEGKLVMPGLIDAHVHTGFGLLRGLSQDISNWMEKGLWPFYDEIGEEEARAGSKLAILEAIKAGTTTFNDFFGNMEILAENHLEMGSRAIVTEMVNEMLKKLTDNTTGLYRLDPVIGQEKRQKAIDLYEKYEGADSGRITCGFGVQAADMISENLLIDMYNLAVSHHKKFMLHVEQGSREIDQMEKRYGMRTIPYLRERGILNENLLAVHLTETAPKDAEELAKTGCCLLHCAGTIGLIDGINPPIGEFLQAGGKVALGSDHVPGNNCSNMFREMKLTALLNKYKYQNPSVFPAWKMLKLCTSEAAEVLGMQTEIGTLTKGKRADIIIVDLMQPNLQPVISHPFRNIAPNLVYSANGSEVETSIIDGKIVMENRKLLTVDEADIISEASSFAASMAKRASNRVAHDSEMLAMMEKGLL